MISDVRLLFIFLALCLAVGTVPVDQDYQGEDKHAVRYEDGVQDRCQRLGLVVGGNNNPRVHSGVVTGEGGLVLRALLSLSHSRLTERKCCYHWMIKIFLGVCITVNFRRVAASLDVDQQRGVLHSVLHPRGFPSVGVRLQFNQYNHHGWTRTRLVFIRNNLICLCSMSAVQSCHDVGKVFHFWLTELIVLFL